MENTQNEGNMRSFLKWLWYRNKSFVSLDEEGLIGSASRDGSCLFHSALAKMTWKDVIRIKNMVDNTPEAQEFLATVKKNINCNSNTETICYLRAALAYELKKKHRAKLEQEDLLSVYEEELNAVLGKQHKGFIGLQPFVLEALATVLNKEVIVFPSYRKKDYLVTCYQVKRENEESSFTCTENNFIDKDGRKTDDYGQIMYEVNQSVSIILNGEHYFPFGNSSLTDKNKNFDNIIQLDSAVKKFLPKGCYDDFFNIFSELDNNKKQIVFKLLNKYKPKYILPVIYYTINKEPDKIKNLNKNYLVKRIFTHKKKLHVNFTKKIGLESLKESPALSKFINLLDPIEAEISASLISEHDQDALSPLYEFSLQEIKTNLIACKILNLSPANLIERYNRDIAATKTAIINKIQEDKNLENILKMPGASEILEQNPESFYEIYLFINREVENLSGNYLQNRLDNLVKYVGFADKKDNEEKQNLNSIKQSLLWHKLANDKDAEAKLGEKMVKSIERFMR